VFDERMQHLARRAALMANNPAFRQAVEQANRPDVREMMHRAIDNLNRPEVRQAMENLNRPEVQQAMENLNRPEVRRAMAEAFNREVRNLTVEEALELAAPRPDGTLVALAEDGARTWTATCDPGTRQINFSAAGFVGGGDQFDLSCPPERGWVPDDLEEDEE
jgi:hypothetical protein